MGTLVERRSRYLVPVALPDGRDSAAVCGRVIDSVKDMPAGLLRSITRDQGTEMAQHALERALDLAEPDGVVIPFLLYPAPGLLQRHAGHRTAHASLIAEIQGVLAGTRPAPPPTRPQSPLEPLGGSEIRVLSYLPTNLTAPEIARELTVSPNTG